LRKLATIKRIIEIRPIEKADNIEIACVDGWEVVVKKGEVNVGDLCVYIEIDSVLPDKPEFEFMRTREFKVKTIKLRGQVSQGIIFPLSILVGGNKLNEGDDVTEVIGVTEYDPQLVEENNAMSIVAKSNWLKRKMLRYAWYRRLKKSMTPDNVFPSWIGKTDEERIQNMPWVCDKYRGRTLTVTEKIDGQSSTYFVERHRCLGIFIKYTFGVCSRNNRLYRPSDNSWWTVAKKLEIAKKLTSLSKHIKQDVAIQGEIIGPKIQGNKYKREGYELYLYNVKARKYGKTYPLDERTVVKVASEMDIPTVPRVGDIEIKDGMTVKDIIEMSNGQSRLANIKREGIVLRYTEDPSMRISFKAISPEFLLKNDE
jgi:hypothetical protein